MPFITILKKKFAHLIVECVKVVYLIYQLTTKTNTMTKTTKIGQGYYQSGYGRGFKKSPIVRLINGKAYVKDATQTPFQTDLEGYVMVNALKTGEKIFFAAVGLISEHQEYIY